MAPTRMVPRNQSFRFLDTRNGGFFIFPQQERKKCMNSYDFQAIEKKWQKYWDDHKTFHAENDYTKPKYYALIEFPYPSGQGLHVGHPRPYTALDIVARKRRMEGYNVLFLRPSYRELCH